MPHGTKETFVGPPVSSPEEQFKYTHELIELGRLRYFEHDDIDLTKQGTLLESTHRSNDHNYYFIPSALLRGAAEIRPLPLRGLSDQRYCDNDKEIGIESELFAVDLKNGLPVPVRGYDRALGNIALIRGASTTPEMTTDMDETDLRPTPLDQVGRLFEDYMHDKVMAFAESGVGISPFARSPQDATLDRLEAHPYIRQTVMSDGSYRDYFGVAGLQLHRSIRRHAETAEEALEFGAYAANRIGAFSWMLSAMSAASPNLEGRDLIERYMESDRLSPDEKKAIRESYIKGNVGYSHRTICRYAGSVSGGIHAQPLPEGDARSVLRLMHLMLKGNQITSPDRVTGEHPDIRIRNTLRDRGYEYSPGTFETLVPDATTRPARVEAIAHLYFWLFEKLHAEWLVASGQNPPKDVFKSPLIRSLISPDNALTVTSTDLNRYRRNSMTVALNNHKCFLHLSDDTQVATRTLADEIINECKHDMRLTGRVEREMRTAFKPIKRAHFILDSDRIPSMATYVYTGEGTVSAVAVERMKAIRERHGGLSHDDYKRLMIVDGAQSLYAYYRSKNGSATAGR